MTVLSDFRETMASLASAVYVITGRDAEDRPRGLTATSVIPHWSDSPRVVVSIDHGAFSHEALVSQDHFGLVILAGDQERTADLFASKRSDKFDRVDWAWREGVPVLDHARGHAVCKIISLIDHGDHTLIVGEPESIELSDTPTLLYWNRRFFRGRLTDPHHGRRPQLMTPDRPDPAELVERADAMQPALRERAQNADKQRTLPAASVDEMRAAGFFRLYQPARYGGFEMPWGVQVQISRALGRACGSTAWIASVIAVHSLMVGRMRQAAQDDVWADDPDAIVATASARTSGKAVPTDGGYLLDGAWRFASGVDHSQWVMVPAPLEGLEADGPAGLRQCLIPSTDYEIIDDWHVTGLRGTGSKQVRIEEPLFVPEHRTLGFLEMLGTRPPGAEINEGYVYRMEYRPYFGTTLLGPIIGTAEGALEDYLEGTRSRIGAIFGDRIADSLPVQLRVAESAAEIGGAGLIVDRMIEVLHERGVADSTLTPKERVESMRDRAFVARRCVDAVHRLVRQMGATGLSDNNPVQRHFRDLSAMAAQIGLNWDRNASTYGQWALGIPTGDRAIDGETASNEGDPRDSLV